MTSASFIFPAIFFSIYCSFLWNVFVSGRDGDFDRFTLLTVAILMLITGVPMLYIIQNLGIAGDDFTRYATNFSTGMTVVSYIFVSVTEESFKIILSLLVFIATRRYGISLIQSSVFAALAFAGVENAHYMKSGIESVYAAIPNSPGHSAAIQSTVMTAFFRSFLSVGVHVLCAIVFASIFENALIKEKSFIKTAKYFSLAILAAILLHTSYNVSITLGWSLIGLIIGVIGIQKLFSPTTENDY